MEVLQPVNVAVSPNLLGIPFPDGLTPAVCRLASIFVSLSRKAWVRPHKREEVMGRMGSTGVPGSQ